MKNINIFNTSNLYLQNISFNINYKNMNKTLICKRKIDKTSPVVDMPFYLARLNAKTMIYLLINWLTD